MWRARHRASEAIAPSASISPKFSLTHRGLHERAVQLLVTSVSTATVLLAKSSSTSSEHAGWRMGCSSCASPLAPVVQQKSVAPLASILCARKAVV